MKEDVLEQLVDDYLQLNGYFTQHNVRFKPDKSNRRYVAREHQVSSDIDVVGFNPRKRGAERVWVVSCKSWQAGFNASHRLEQLRGKRPNPKREVWRSHRELWDPVWAESFRRKVRELTGQEGFHYWVAVTRLTGAAKDPGTAADLWATDKTIRKNLAGSKISFLEFKTIWETVFEGDSAQKSKSPAPSEIGRLAQLMRAAGIR